jgi:hypothetical protein
MNRGGSNWQSLKKIFSGNENPTPGLRKRARLSKLSAKFIRKAE